MNNYEIKFVLNDNEKIVINLEEPFEVVHCCYQAPITFFFENQIYLLGDEVINYRIGIFSVLLERAIEGKLKLHKSITEDIGFLFNEYLYCLYNEKLKDQTKFVYKKSKEGRSYWIGDSYNLWSSEWIYNNKDGAIIFEVTPVYPYHFVDPTEEPNFVPYAEWIKDYKPFFIKKIPLEIAKKWLKQANDLLETIKENTARERAEQENDADEGITLNL
jgi:hypothetical protein